jgi:hypothetical protein
MESGSDRHRYFEELAVSHVLGGLSESDGRVFRSHLLDCPHCRARVGELRRIANDLADVERDERRVRAAKAIDTKRREDEEEVDADEAPTSTRGSRVALFVGFLLLIGLLSWNFLLRGENAEQATKLEGAQITTDLLIENNEALHTSPTGQFSAPPNKVVYNDDYAVIVMDGVEQGEVYAVYLLSEDDEIINMVAQAPVTDRMTLLVPRRGGVRNLQVIQPETLPPNRSEREGTTVLDANLS